MMRWFRRCLAEAWCDGFKKGALTVLNELGEMGDLTTEQVAALTAELDQTMALVRDRALR